MHPKRWTALFGISLLCFTAFLDVTIVNTALPFIQLAFHSPVLELQWISNVFAMVLSMTMIVAGDLADRFGRKRIFFIGVSLFAIAAWGAGASPSMAWLIFFRALQGLGASVMYVSGAVLLNDLFSREEHPKAVSIYAGITGAGLVLGPAVGGFLVGWLDWRWVFWVNIPLIIVGFSLCAVGFRGVKSAHEKATTKIDWLGAVLLVLGLGGVTYGIISGANIGWLEVATGLPLIGGLIALIALMIIERRIAHPLLNLQILGNKFVALATVSCLVAGIVVFVFIFFDPLYLKSVRDLSPFAIGFFIAVLPLAQVLISFCFARLLRIFGLANLLILSIGSATLAAWMHYTFSATLPFAWIIVPFFLLGVNWALSNMCLMSTINQEIPHHKGGASLGTVTTLWNMSGSIFLAVSSALFHQTQTSSNGDFLPAFQAAVFFNAVLISAMLVAGLWIRRQV